MGCKFDSKRYITTGIISTIPLNVQIALFAGLDTMREKVNGELDYLQVFRLKTVEQNGELLLHIQHEQEVPEAKLEYVLLIDKPINTKIFIIDDVDHVTMLLAEEY